MDHEGATRSDRLRQRAVGACARAGAGALGAGPATLVAFGPDRIAFGVLAGAFVAAWVYFALERRDRGWPRAVAVTCVLTAFGLLPPGADRGAGSDRA